MNQYGITIMTWYGHNFLCSSHLRRKVSKRSRTVDDRLYLMLPIKQCGRAPRWLSYTLNDKLAFFDTQVYACFMHSWLTYLLWFVVLYTIGVLGFDPHFVFVCTVVSLLTVQSLTLSRIGQRLWFCERAWLRSALWVRLYGRVSAYRTIVHFVTDWPALVFL